MGKRVEEDAHVNTEKKSKKSKNKTNDLPDVGDDNRQVEVDGDVPKKKGHKHKEKKRKSESNEDQHDTGNLEGDCILQKKEKKRKRDSSEKTQIEENEQDRDDEPAVEKDCDPKPRKEKKRKHKHHSNESELENDMIEKVDKKKKKKKKTDDETNGITTEESSGDKAKKKTKSVEKKSEKRKSKSKLKTTKSVEENNVENKKAKTKGKSKKVSFSGQVEVFPSSDTETEKRKTKEDDGLVRGKRFTPEEDEIVKEAVLNYIEVHNLGDDGLKMILNCRSYKGMKLCWQEIATCIPYRPSSAVYYRAHILFERAETRSWTPEEIELLKELHEKNGNNWKKMAEELGKHRFHVKDTWRRIKLKDLKSGRWTQDEYQNLYDLVNLDLQMKVSSEVKQSKHGMLRDNIPWTAISEKLSTRSDSTCCDKWYNQLTSSLVVEKKWSDADDYRLIGALYELDAACEEDVDWDGLLEHRPGEICLKRWNQMVRHIGHRGSKPFSEQVDMLAKRYCPDLAEIREAWDDKPVV